MFSECWSTLSCLPFMPSMLFSVIPIALVFFGIMLTTEYTPDMVWLLGMILLVTTLCGLASVPLWIRVVYRLGKHRSWAWGWLFNSIVLVPMIWVEPFEPAG